MVEIRSWWWKGNSFYIKRKRGAPGCEGSEQRNMSKKEKCMQKVLSFIVCSRVGLCSLWTQCPWEIFSKDLLQIIFGLRFVMSWVCLLSEPLQLMGPPNNLAQKVQLCSSGYRKGNPGLEKKNLPSHLAVAMTESQLKPYLWLCESKFRLWPAWVGIKHRTWFAWNVKKP
jgi:hypothetical protein